MFNDLVKRNSRRARKDNALYFGSMIVSVVAFYIILSLSNQDVMIFLRTMESDAVSRLFAIIPIFYVASLFLLFFLVYYANRMQMERRRHEFGVYLTLGMKRRQLFRMLFLETLRNGAIALVLGLVLAIMISELVSLVTAKIIGLGIVGHRFTFSLPAIIFTIVGFLLVQVLAFALLSSKVAQEDIAALLRDEPAGAKLHHSTWLNILALILGVALLIKAYRLGILGTAWTGVTAMAVTLILGCLGTILIFYGLRVLIEAIIKAGSHKKLHRYNFRQIQELVVDKSTNLAICSLLILAALCLSAAGIAIAGDRAGSEQHVLDYTFFDYSYSLSDDGALHVADVRTKLREAGALDNFESILEIRIGRPVNPGLNATVSFEKFTDPLKSLKKSEGQEILLNYLDRQDDCYLIPLSDYNQLKRLSGDEPLMLQPGEAGLYQGVEDFPDEALMKELLEQNPRIEVLEEEYKLKKEVEDLPLTTDRAISLALALIVPDDDFERYTEGSAYPYVSAVLKLELVQEKGLMRAIQETNERLDQSSISYESYLQNMGRQLFYIVATSYLSLYLAVIFLVVANTIMGVQFLMAQRKGSARFQTLVHLGATSEVLCASSNKQINWYFGLPIALALINSLFGVRAVFTGILPRSLRDQVGQHLLTAAVIIALLAVVEAIYLRLVKKSSRKYILARMAPRRDE